MALCPRNAPFGTYMVRNCSGPYEVSLGNNVWFDPDRHIYWFFNQFHFKWVCSHVYSTECDLVCYHLFPSVPFPLITLYDHSELLGDEKRRNSMRYRKVDGLIRSMDKQLSCSFNLLTPPPTLWSANSIPTVPPQMLPLWTNPTATAMILDFIVF